MAAEGEIEQQATELQGTAAACAMSHAHTEKCTVTLQDETLLFLDQHETYDDATQRQEAKVAERNAERQAARERSIRAWQAHPSGYAGVARTWSSGGTSS